jgi:flagellar basal-body rod protein FlgB
MSYHYELHGPTRIRHILCRRQKDAARHCFGAYRLLPAVILKDFLAGKRDAYYGSVMLDRLSGQLEHYMDLLSTRQKLVASNIANADTPGYHTQDIDFQTELQNAVSGQPNVMDVSGLQMKNDGNNVSLDREARLLSENALRFNVAANLLRVQIQSLRSAIKEGQSS